MTDLSLLAHVTKLAELREEVARRAEGIRALRAAFEWSISEETRGLEATKRACEVCESDVRGLALVDHARTGNTKPAAGVSVVMAKHYAIDETAAFAWAQSTGLCLIPERVDLLALKKIASVQALPFVVVTDEPAVRLSTDLTKALAEVTA